MSVMNFDFAQFQQQEQRRSELMQPLIAQGIPMLTAIVMAGDLQTAEIASEMVDSGTPAVDALNFVGSYSRFDWAIAHLPKPTLFKMLPELWRGADPDDTKPEYLALWKEAYKANGKRIIIDSKRLAGYASRRVYRGQVGDVVGISWTLDKKIAEKFAATGGMRQQIRGGKVLTRIVPLRNILAYLTGRGESEVIIDIGESK